MKLLALFSISILAIGCYTVFTHPKLSETMITEKEFLDTNVNHVDDCSQCHNSNYRHPYTGNYILVHPQYEWQYFYDIPWWTEERYYTTAAEENREAGLPPTYRRNFQRSEQPPGYSATSAAPAPANLSKSTSAKSSSTSKSTVKSKRTIKRRDYKAANKKHRKPAKKNKNSKKD